MKVVTESFLRARFRTAIPETFMVEAGQILTPSAAQLLSEKGVRVVSADDIHSQGAPVEDAAVPVWSPRYVLAGGGLSEDKPAHMTELHGNRLVPKDHPRIALRGQLERVEADTLLVQHKAAEAGRKKLVADLDSFLTRLRALLAAEITDADLAPGQIMDLGENELRAQAAEPGRTELHHGLGGIVLGLNALRCAVREAERLAVAAYRHEFECEKPECIQALNAMSHAVTLLMRAELAGTHR